ncbi:MAG TPA: hypothetical protein DIW15_05195 [Bavariicoccus seileri]|uniref:Competence protein ComGD n=1 Tax=Bavariicoccus seileri TaxID=549685 RepID=A0A3D4S5I2_9ENTE|nr:competence type IV pilus minor pilin ComGD [Bavariicoccus seileri]HCS94084.1 hypothetical protein [Bavariicoccus seileri]
MHLFSRLNLSQTNRISHRGFTLIHTLLVLVIISGSVLLISVNPLERVARLEEELILRQFEAQVSLLQSYSYLKEKPTRIQFRPYPTNRIDFIGVDANDIQIESVVLPSSIHLKTNTSIKFSNTGVSNNMITVKMQRHNEEMNYRFQLGAGRLFKDIL